MLAKLWKWLTPPTCPRCHIERDADGPCEWCSHDPDDPGMVEALKERRRQHAAYRQLKGREKNALAKALDQPSFMGCPACGQWGSYGMCDWCSFDASDPVAVDARRRWAETRKVTGKARRRDRMTRAYRGVASMVRFDVGEQVDLVRFLVKWIVLGAIVGVLAGLSGAAFLASLQWVTETRESTPWLLFLLPFAGLLIGLAYHHGGGTAVQGNNLIIDEIHEPKAWIPRRMAPLIYGGTIVTHLFGGSAGREGTAIQMSGGLTDWFARVAHIQPEDRRLLLIAAIAGGFGAVFGVPLAGCVFALEVQSIGRLRYDALVPALSASIVGDLVVRALGVHHMPAPIVDAVELTPMLVGKVIVAGIAFGLCAVVFIELTHGLKRVFASTVSYPPLRPFIGGVAVIGLTYAVGTRDYLGLSIPLLTDSLAGAASIVAFAFALKLLFTAVTLGSGFQGGEVTPLFVIGATLGVTMGHLLGLPLPLAAAIGFVAVFAGASNTPLACTIMGLELFGVGPLVPLVIACTVAYVSSSHRSIYTSQRIDSPKHGQTLDEVATVSALAERRRPWLPPLRGAQPIPDEPRTA
jgi:H+/Cl- antiporter ClcA